MSAGDYTFTNSQSLSASIVIRQYDDGNGAMIWKIVEWHDDWSPPARISAFDDLTQREHILTNLEQAYNSMDFLEADKLLDDNFTFFFGQADIDNGNVASPDWDRDSESNAVFTMFAIGTGIASASAPSTIPTEEATWGRTKALFEGTISGPADHISLNMTWPPGEFSWTQIQAPGGTETWYEKTVQYTLLVVAGETTHVNALVLSASFVIRFDTGAGQYRIVQWRDDI